MLLQRRQGRREGKVVAHLLQNQCTASESLTLAFRHVKSTAVKASSFERLLHEILPTLDERQRQSVEECMAQVTYPRHSLLHSFSQEDIGTYWKQGQRGPQK